MKPACDLPLPAISDITLGGWDLTTPDPASVCRLNRVFGSEKVLNVLPKVPPPRVFRAVVLPTDYECVRNRRLPTHSNSQAALDDICRDIDAFRRAEAVDEIVVINLASPPRQTLTRICSGQLNSAILRNGESVTSALVYCLGAIRSGCSYVDFTATDTLALPDLESEALKYGVPLAGRDGSTGQTLMKSVIAHMFQLRHLSIEGWYSTNILGNNDGLVLADPEFATTKISDKKEVLDLLAPEKPHLVDIRYYPPRGDCKEAWDCIDFSGWMGELMSLRLNWIGRDSVLAAPLVIDLARLMTCCKSRGRSGIQAGLGVFFKHPMGTAERRYFSLFEAFEALCGTLAKEQ